jgi:hypothetical protein
MHLSKLLFPDPFGPINPTTWPSGNAKETPRKTSLPE